MVSLKAVFVFRAFPCSKKVVIIPFIQPQYNAEGIQFMYVSNALREVALHSLLLKDMLILTPKSQTSQGLSHPYASSLMLSLRTMFSHAYHWYCIFTLLLLNLATRPPRFSQSNRSLVSLTREHWWCLMAAPSFALFSKVTWKLISCDLHILMKNMLCYSQLKQFICSLVHFCATIFSLS